VSFSGGVRTHGAVTGRLGRFVTRRSYKGSEHRPPRALSKVAPKRYRKLDPARIRGFCVASPGSAVPRYGGWGRASDVV